MFKGSSEISSVVVAASTISKNVVDLKNENEK